MFAHQHLGEDAVGQVTIAAHVHGLLHELVGLRDAARSRHGAVVVDAEQDVTAAAVRESRDLPGQHPCVDVEVLDRDPFELGPIILAQLKAFFDPRRVHGCSTAPFLRTALS